MGVVLLVLLIVLASMVHEMRKSHKHEAKQSGQPPPISSAHVKTAPTKPQEVVIACEKEDSLLPKNSNSRSQRVLNRSRLRQSILASEILGKKY